MIISEHHLSGTNTFVLVCSDRVLCFYFRACAFAMDTYHVGMHVCIYASSTISWHSGAETKM